MGILFYITFYYFLLQYTSTNAYFSTKISKKPSPKNSKDSDFPESIKTLYVLFFVRNRSFRFLIFNRLCFNFFNI